MNNDDFFSSNNLSSGATSKLQNGEKFVVAKKAIAQYVEYFLFGIAFIAATIFLLVKFKNKLDVLVYIEIAMTIMGLVLLLIGLIGFLKPMELAYAQGNKLWVYKRGEYNISDIRKVCDRSGIDLSSDSLLLANKKSNGKMIIKLNNGKKIIIHNVENVRRSVLNFKKFLGL